MDLTPWIVTYKEGWDILLHGFPHDIQDRILKKIEQMKQPLQGRGLHGSHFQVEEVGEHRIAYSLDSTNRIKEIHFVGNHKQYEKWYTQNIGFRDEDWSMNAKTILAKIE